MDGFEMTLHRTGSSRRRKRAGFTMVELMVATAAGGTVIASTYFIGAASTRFLNEQARTSRSQMDLRMALERLRSDIERSGYLASPNSGREEYCTAPDQPVRAVEYIYNDPAVDDTVLPYMTENRARADRIRLVANYSTNDSYLASSLAADGSKIYLQQTWQAFNRSFTSGGSLNEALFEGAFAAGRMLHIETPAGKHYFKTIASSEHTTASITFSSPISLGDVTNQRCLAGFGEAARVAPLSRIEYYVGDLTGGASGATLGTSNDPAQLIRHEIQFDSTTAVADTKSILADYVASFAINWLFDENTTVGGEVSMKRRKQADAASTMSSNPEFARAAILMLAVRNPEDTREIRWPFTPANGHASWTRPASTPFARYLIRKDTVSSPARGFAARVRSVRTMAVLQNLAARGLK